MTARRCGRIASSHTVEIGVCCFGVGIGTDVVVSGARDAIGAAIAVGDGLPIRGRALTCGRYRLCIGETRSKEKEGKNNHRNLAGTNPKEASSEEREDQSVLCIRATIHDGTSPPAQDDDDCRAGAGRCGNESLPWSETLTRLTILVHLHP